MEKLIAVAPSVAELVLEKCVITQPNYQLPDQTETKKVIFFVYSKTSHQYTQVKWKLCNKTNPVFRFSVKSLF